MRELFDSVAKSSVQNIAETAKNSQDAVAPAPGIARVFRGESGSAVPPPHSCACQCNCSCNCNCQSPDAYSQSNAGVSGQSASSTGGGLAQSLMR
jgi:hypothetical protein